MVPSLSAGLSAEGVFDFSLPFVKASEFNGTEIDFPEPVVDLFECHELLSQEVADVDPAGVPADASIATDAADLEVGWVLEGWEAVGVRPG